MLALLDEVSKKLDKNFVLQVVTIFSGFVIVWKGPAEKIDLPLGFSLPGDVVKYAIPLVLIKLIMDWGYESYQYLLTRHYLSIVLEDELCQVNKKYFPAA